MSQEARAYTERIGQRLDELRALAGPLVWPRIEELVSGLVALYGEGLAQLLRCARACARDGEELEDALAQDALLAALLSLHELHARSREQRAQRALARSPAHEQFGALGLELLAIEGETAQLRVRKAPPPTDAARVLHAVHTALRGALPELSDVQIHGLQAHAPSGFVSLSRLQARKSHDGSP